MADAINITINDMPLEAKPGTTLLNAAKELGINIPVFCYHEKLGPLGCCRICLVEETAIMRKVVPACTVVVMEGMKVLVDSEKAKKARKGIIEFTLLNHPLDCPVCDKGGECPLQDQTYEHGGTESRFDLADKKHLAKAHHLSDMTVLDRERCILCQRCVRFSSIIEGTKELVLQNRGVQTCIDTYNGQPYDSIFAGNTHEICPTGALTSTKFRFKARSWEMKKVPSVCVGCGMGCNVDINVRNDRALRLTLVEDDVVSDGWLCDAGRFGTLEYVEDDSLLSSPKDRLTRIDRYTAEAADAIKKAWNGKGKGNLSVIMSENVTNEEAYLLKNLADSFGGKIAVTEPHQTVISSELATMSDLENAETILLVNADVKNVTPSLYLRLQKLSRQGKRVIAVDAIQNDSTDFVDEFHHVKQSEIARTISDLSLLEGTVMIYTPERVCTFAKELSLFVIAQKGMKTLPITTSYNQLGATSIVGNKHSIEDILAETKAGITDALIVYKKDIISSSFAGGIDVKAALEKAKCLIVIDNQANSCEEHARVIVHCEKFTNYSGSLVNIEGRIQWMNSRQKKYSDGNFEIFELLYQKLGLDWNYKSIIDITEDVVSNVNAFKKTNVKAIQKGEAFISYSETTTTNVEMEKGSLVVAPYTLLVNGEKKPFVENLEAFIEKQPLLINPADAKNNNIEDNASVEVKMNGSVLTCKASVTDRILEGEIGLPYYADESYLRQCFDPKAGFGSIEVKKDE